MRSVDDRHINTVFPKTFEVYKNWDRQDLPPEKIYEAMFFEVLESKGFNIGKASTRMNYSKSGWKSLLKKSKRKFDSRRQKETDIFGTVKNVFRRVDHCI